MQFVGRKASAKKRRSRRHLLNFYDSEQLHPHVLSTYNEPPTYDITLQEFESYAFERVQVLYYLDTLAISHVKSSDIYNQKLTEYLRKNYQGFLLKNSNEPTEAEIEWRKRDHISHFILRLAYSRSEDLRQWFIEKELDLFKFRFSREDSASIQQFLLINSMTYTPISEEEKEKHSENLLKSSFELTKASLKTTSFYKVAFTEVLNLVRSRKVFLYAGFAFVSQSNFVSIMSTKFRENLSHQLTLTLRALPQLEEKDRILPILRSFSKEAVSAAYDQKNKEGNIEVKDIDHLSKESFPLCMRQLHDHLKDAHHLRYNGRMQYGLFLKGIGVSLESAIKFWRKEFTKGMTLDKFDKQYLYNIRHNYGKEGKRTNYSPYSCMHIITKNPPSGQDHHGCPFKHCSPSLLRQRLAAYKTPKNSVDEIVDLVKKHHYQIACQKYFAVKHGLDDHTAVQVTHPNSYFDESRRLLNGEKPKSKSSNFGNKNEFVPEWSQQTDQTDLPKKKDDDEDLDRLLMEYIDEEDIVET